MKHYIVVNLKNNSLRSGTCQDIDFPKQAHKDEYVFEGTINQIIQKIIFDGIDEEGKPINLRIVNKTPQEIKAEKPPEIPENEKPVVMTKGQLQQILNRIETLEGN